MNYWLIKSEANCYSIDDLKKDRRTLWTGIRNFQARNYMRDGMKRGDLALFYHSIGTADMPAGVYGVAKVTREAVIDPTSLDPKDEHFDPRMFKAQKEGKLVVKNSGNSDGIEGWVSPEVSFQEKLAQPVTLAQIKIDPVFNAMILVRPGSRLSVMPVAKHHFEKVLKNGGMNFKKYFESLKRLNLPVGQFVVAGSGALSVRGIRDSKDLDVIVTESLLDRLIQGNRIGANKFGVQNIELDGSIEILNPSQSMFTNSTIIPVKDVFEKADEFDGVKFINLEHLKKFKITLSREKDLRDVVLIDDYLRGKSAR